MKKIVLFLLSSAFLLSAVLPTHAVLPKEFYEEYNLGAEYYLAGGVYYSSFQDFSEYPVKELLHVATFMMISNVYYYAS